MKTLILILIVGCTSQAFAFEKEDTSLSFSEALMNSNKDYSDHKKIVLNEENSDIDNWRKGRDLDTLIIKADIRVEAKDFGKDSEINKKQMTDFKVKKTSEVQVLHEVSMNK